MSRRKPDLNSSFNVLVRSQYLLDKHTSSSCGSSSLSTNFDLLSPAHNKQHICICIPITLSVPLSVDIASLSLRPHISSFTEKPVLVNMYSIVHTHYAWPRARYFPLFYLAKSPPSLFIIVLSFPSNPTSAVPSYNMPNRYIFSALVQAMQTLLKTLSKPLSTLTILGPYLYPVFIANSANLGSTDATFRRVYGEFSMLLFSPGIY